MVGNGVDPEALAGELIGAEPFDHIVIDDSLEEAKAHRLADLIEVADNEDWTTDPLPQQVNKWSEPDLHLMRLPVAHALWVLNQAPALQFFGTLTGISHLPALPSAALPGDALLLGGQT